MREFAMGGAADVSQCPMMTAEHMRVKSSHQALASTGCSKDFCQAGRMLHTDEPRVGQNRSLQSVCQDAEAFLEDLFQDGHFTDREAFEARLQEVIDEINLGATEGVTSEDKAWRKLGGNWTQTYEELEFGIRRSWRNSRKCIARNHHQELKLCDLRSITKSSEMATELLRNALVAFNNGRVEPTVFVFPPRQSDGRGPMIWNNQILGFAGYKMDDDTILGDPGNVELTTAIIELGWNPPNVRSQWDLLPLVVMAEGDKPAMIQIPAPLSTLVQIHHPGFPGIGELGLRWVAAPALTRLGFDIGGVQYTAAPFIGWFMDAEIGVRNLADSFRYNVLPQVVKAMGLLTEGNANDDVEDFEDLPEYEQLKMLSSAQSELTYATQWSYNKAGVTMSDSLSASKKWCKFDDEFKEKNGYRLPSDPYWIAPPQGSIIPVWHRGGAPNYQPKPMITKHVQDPIKAWKRDMLKAGLTSYTSEMVVLQHSIPSIAEPYTKWPKRTFDEAIECEDAVRTPSSYSPSDSLVSTVPSTVPSPYSMLSQTQSSSSTLIEAKTIAIYYCSAGTVAEKLAKKIYKLVESVKKTMDVSLHPRVEGLDHLKADDITPDKILLFIVSSVGKGEVPANGSAFLRLKAQASFQGVSFAVFGNGDSRYSSTYNGAANIIDTHMQSLGGRSMLEKVFRGDTATEPIPYKAAKNWWSALQPKVNEILCGGGMDDTPVFNPSAIEAGVHASSNEVTERLVDCVDDIHKLKSASIVATTRTENSMLLTLNIGDEEYDDANCIQILPVNHSSKVDRALAALGANANEVFEIKEDTCTTNAEFLSKCADLERPFKSLDWLRGEKESIDPLIQSMFGNLSALECLELFSKTNLISQFDLGDILRSMELLHLRTFSVASSPMAQDSTADSSSANDNTVSVMLKRRPEGRFSTTFLDDHAEESYPQVNYRIVDSVAGPSIRTLIPDPVTGNGMGNANAPLVLVGTGAGFGPLRDLILARTAVAQQPNGGAEVGAISVYLGLHPADVPLVQPTLEAATQAGSAEKVEIVESNEEKLRVQDALAENAEEIREVLEEKGGQVFVCANEQAAAGIKGVFKRVMPEAFEEGKTPEWYLEECF